MAGARGRARPDAVDSQLLTQLANEVEALARRYLADRALCHQLTPLFCFGCPAVLRLSAGRGGPLVRSVRPAAARPAAPAIPGIGRPDLALDAAWLARRARPGLGFDQRRRDVAPITLGQQMADVQFGQRGRTLAA